MKERKETKKNPMMMKMMKKKQENNREEKKEKNKYDGCEVFSLRFFFSLAFFFFNFIFSSSHCAHSAPRFNAYNVVCSLPPILFYVCCAVLKNELSKTFVLLLHVAHVVIWISISSSVFWWIFNFIWFLTLVFFFFVWAAAAVAVTVDASNALIR